MKKTNLLISIGLIIILGFAVYANSLNGKFIWDDRYLIKDNTYIKDFSNIKKIFTQGIGAGAGIESSSYRPIQMITYIINYSLWRLDVQGYHLTNVLLHIMAALSIFWLTFILFGNRFISLFTSALFVVHPIHTEAVSYISGRADSLAALFMLLSFILYIKYLDKKNTLLYIFTLLAYTLALLSRENSLILPALLLLYHYDYSASPAEGGQGGSAFGGRKKFKIKEFLPVLVIGFVYILLRLTILKAPLPHTSGATTLFQRMPGFFVAITNYIRLLFLPFNLHMEYGDRLFGLADPRALLGIIIAGLSLIYAFRIRKSNALIFFGVLWFFLTLVVQSNLYPTAAYMAEHWLYLPSIGFFLILANGFKAIQKSRTGLNLSYFFIIILLVFYSYLTIRQNNYWREPIAFYKRTLEYAPDSPRVYNDLGIAYHDMGRYREAIAPFEKAVKLKPDYVMAYINLGKLYNSVGKRGEAITVLKQAIEIDPTCAGAYNNLGMAYDNIAEREEAMLSYKKAIEINPNFAEAHNNLGVVYIKMGRRDEAMVLFKKAIKVNPAYADAYSNLGNVHKEMGNYKEAMVLYKKAVAIDPNHMAAEFLKKLKP